MVFVSQQLENQKYFEYFLRCYLELLFWDYWMDYSFYLCCCQVSHEVKSIKAFLGFTDNASSYLKIAGFYFLWKSRRCNCWSPISSKLQDNRLWLCWNCTSSIIVSSDIVRPYKQLLSWTDHLCRFHNVNIKEVLADVLWKMI